jgi:hypothetical protein
MLGAGAFAISVISGAGEFLGYNIRTFSGRGADRTGGYWPITREPATRPAGRGFVIRETRKHCP